MAVTDERLEGYEHWQGHDNFEDFVGPLFYKKEADGQYRCAFVIEDKHVNGQKGVHGGMLMTFADYALFMFARDRLDGARAVTVSFSSDFTSGAREGEFVQSTGEVVHETRGMLFLRGTIFTDDRVLLNYTAVLKKLRPKTESN